MSFEGRVACGNLIGHFIKGSSIKRVIENLILEIELFIFFFFFFCLILTKMTLPFSCKNNTLF